MNTAAINTAHKGRRSTFADLAVRIRDFAVAMYAAHGGWFVIDAAQPASGALAAQGRNVRLATTGK